MPMKRKLILLIGICLPLFIATPSKADNSNRWISRKTLESCMAEARKRNIQWNYVAYVENDKANLLSQTGRGGDVFLCNYLGDGKHWKPVY